VDASAADPLRVGLIGSGPWARAVTGPVLAAGPETRLAGVWSRTPAHRAAAAEQLGAPAFGDVDALLEACDAVAIAVTPEAQPDLAVRVARAGKPMLLEKPLAAGVDGARRVAAAVEEAGVPTLMMLSYRFHPLLPAFAEAAAAVGALGGRGCFLSGAFLPGSPYACGWRLARGALLDVGPHLLDLHEVALGEIAEVHAAGDVHGWLSLTLRHASGATSQASICCRVASGSRTEVEVFGPGGVARFDGREGDPREVGANMRATFARVARGEPHPCDARRGVRLQELVARAEAQLAG
jgi:predicted dehydrogenase